MGSTQHADDVKLYKLSHHSNALTAYVRLKCEKLQPKYTTTEVFKSAEVESF